MLNDIERGYIAGFIDGEGCIAITKRMARSGRNYSYRVEVIVAQANRGRAVLDWLQARIGGRIHETHNGTQATLRLAAKDSAALAAWIGPYSVIKLEQWRIVHAFLNTFEGCTRLNGLLAPDVVEERERLYVALMTAHGGSKKRRVDWTTRAPGASQI